MKQFFFTSTDISNNPNIYSFSSELIYGKLINYFVTDSSKIIFFFLRFILTTRFFNMISMMDI